MTLRQRLEEIIGPPLRDADPETEFDVTYVMGVHRCSPAKATRIIRDRLASGEFVFVGWLRMPSGKMSKHYRLSDEAGKETALAQGPTPQPAQADRGHRVPKKVRKGKGR